MNRRLILIIASLISIIGVFCIYQQHPVARLSIEFFDVGQGDSILINTINDKHILIDTGPDNRIVEKLQEHFQFFKDDIDYLILTHCDSDHIGGMRDVLINFDIKNIVFNFEVDTSKRSQKDLDNLIIKEGSTIIKVDEESEINIDGVRLDFVWPSSQTYFANLSNNDSSISFKLSYNGFAIFLGGDISSSVEKKIISQVGSVDVMKIDHHGSNSASDIEFLTYLEPKIAVISVGKANRYGHPSEIVLGRLRDLKIKIYRTDKDGDVVCQINSKEDYICY